MILILILLLIAPVPGILAGDSKAIARLDAAFLSHLRLVFRGLPERTQCEQTWKALQLRINGEKSINPIAPLADQIDTKLLVEAADMFRGKIWSTGHNNLVDYLDECVKMLDNKLTKDDEEASTLEVSTAPIERPLASIGSWIAHLKKMQGEVEGIKRERAVELERIKELKLRNEILVEQVEQKSAEVDHLRSENGELQQVKEKLKRAISDNKELRLKNGDLERMYKQMFERVERLTKG